MALFGSSPLLLSAIATHQFNNEPSGINVTHFLAFLSLLTGAVHAFGAAALPSGGEQPVLSSDASAVVITTDEESEILPTSDMIQPSETDVSETSALLASKTHKLATQIDIVPVQEPQHGSSLDLLKDRYFWVLAVVIVIILGTVRPHAGEFALLLTVSMQSEMVMANLASIFLSLVSQPTTSTSTIATQVQILSMSNTATRLVIGPLADLLSPVAAYILSHTSSTSSNIPQQSASSSAPAYVYSFPRRQHISRVIFLTAAASLLLITFTFLEVFVRSTDTLWVVRYVLVVFSWQRACY